MEYLFVHFFSFSIFLILRVLVYLILFYLTISRLKCTSVFNSPICQSSEQRAKSCTRRKDCEEPPRVVCKKKKNCQSKPDKKRCVKPEKERPKCTGNNRKRSESCRKRKLSRSSDKNCGKTDGKRHYSQQSIFSVSRNHRSFSTMIPNIVLYTDARKTTKASSCDKKNEKKDPKQSLSCEKPKRKCETTRKDETKRKCVKGSAKCLSRKSTADKMQTCQSTQRGKDKELREPEKSCNHAEYCANRKLESITIGKYSVCKL